MSEDSIYQAHNIAIDNELPLFPLINIFPRDAGKEYIKCFKGKYSLKEVNEPWFILTHISGIPLVGHYDPSLCKLEDMGLSEKLCFRVVLHRKDYLSIKDKYEMIYEELYTDLPSIIEYEDVLNTGDPLNVYENYKSRVGFDFAEYDENVWTCLLDQKVYLPIDELEIKSDKLDTIDKSLRKDYGAYCYYQYDRFCHIVITKFDVDVYSFIDLAEQKMPGTSVTCSFTDDETLDNFLYHTVNDGNSNSNQSIDEDFDENKVIPVDSETDYEVDINTFNEAPQFLAFIFYHARMCGSSDIHIYEKKGKLSFNLRVDGEMHEKDSIELSWASEVLTFIKSNSGMRTSEKRNRQSGRLVFSFEDSFISCRVSMLPHIRYESCVIRLLDLKIITVKDIALPAKQESDLVLCTTRKNGLFLMAGPTGSGKTTTLHALLKHTYNPRKKYITLEDPPEIIFENAVQSPIKKAIGYTFEAALEEALRQDPDVIMVGEIRSRETAHLAFQAANTGHYVLSSIHANDGINIIDRLDGFGIERFQIGNMVNIVASQLLPQTVCSNCRKDIPLTLFDTEEQLNFKRIISRYERLLSGSRKLIDMRIKEYEKEGDIFVDIEEMKADPQLKLFESQYKNFKNYINDSEPMISIGEGCTKCLNRGVKGRKAIMEVFPIDDEIQRAILNGENTKNIKNKVLAKGYLTLNSYLINLLINGQANLDIIKENNTL